MTSIRTNATQLAREWGRRRREMDAALLKNMTRAAAAVDKAQVKNLSGHKGAAPGTYPVPNRTGNLMKSHFFQVNSNHEAYVGNTAAYALPVHQGESAGRSGGFINPRPFLDDAVQTVKPTEMIMDGFSKAVLA